MYGFLRNPIELAFSMNTPYSWKRWSEAKPSNFILAVALASNVEREGADSDMN